MTTIQVNERTKAGKALIETARVMAEKYKGIEVVQDNADDLALLKKMLAARKSGVVSREQVMETLTGIIEK